MEKKVFIIGVSRTGSKIYKNLINNFSHINISGELHLFEPSWLRKDLRSIINSQVGEIDNHLNIKKVIDLFYSKTLPFTFFRSESEIGAIDWQKLEHRLKTADLNHNSLFSILIEEHAKANGKLISGAKFPMNIVYADKLLQWYPDSKIILLIRDPRAIFPSMYRNNLKKLSVQKYHSKLYRNLFKFTTFCYLIQQYKMAAKFYEKHMLNKNIYLSRFEDLINDPRKSIQGLCSFLNIEYREQMLYPDVYDSSFKSDRSIKGFDSIALVRWKSHILPATSKLLYYS